MLHFAFSKSLLVQSEILSRFWHQVLQTEKLLN